MSPGNSSGAPRQEDAAQLLVTTNSPIVTAETASFWSDATLDRLAQLPSDALALAAEAWRTGRDEGYIEGFRCGYLAAETDMADAWSEVAETVRTGASTPQRANLQRLRYEPDFTPCAERCRACSRCIASLSFWERGGRPYLGVEAERLLAESSEAAA